MIFRSLLPIDHYTLSTRLSEFEVLKRLNEMVEPGDSLFTSAIENLMKKRVASDKPYAGVVKDRHFDIYPATDYSNSFLPMIRGNINGYSGRTEINIKMRPHKFVVAFSAFWLLGVAGFCCLMVMVMIQEGFRWPLLVPFVMLIFGGRFFTRSYKTEAKKNQALLADLLEEEDKLIV